MATKTQNRWKSPVLWTSVLSTVLLVGSALLKVDFDANALSQSVAILLGLLVAFGIVNDPTNKTGL